MVFVMSFHFGNQWNLGITGILVFIKFGNWHLFQKLNRLNFGGQFYVQSKTEGGRFRDFPFTPCAYSYLTFTIINIFQQNDKSVTTDQRALTNHYYSMSIVYLGFILGAVYSLSMDRCITIHTGFPGSLDGKESTWIAGDLDLIPGSGKIPWRNGHLLQHSCLEISMGRGARQATVHGVQSQTWQQFNDVYLHQC